MTKDKDLKRRIRARMAKTGESYTTARTHLLARKPSPPLPKDYEKVAGMRDSKLVGATGKTWPEWAEVLDAVDATSWRHGEITDHLHREHGVPGWWTQMVAVGYERLRGLREVGQRLGGEYEISKSKTVPVSLADLWRAFVDDSLRARWLPDTVLTVSTLREQETLRTRLDDGTRLDIYFAGKGPLKSAVTLQHRKLPDRSTAERMKAFWGERLQALAEALTGSE